MERLNTRDDAMECARLMAKLTGILRFHLAAEDNSLYPRMQASPDPEVSQTAAAFAAEMGGLAELFEDFVSNWPDGAAIFVNPEGFRTEAALVFSALSRRIKRENDELYPLADTMISVGKIELSDPGPRKPNRG